MAYRKILVVVEVAEWPRVAGTLLFLLVFEPNVHLHHWVSAARQHLRLIGALHYAYTDTYYTMFFFSVPPKGIRLGFLYQNPFDWPKIKPKWIFVSFRIIGKAENQMPSSVRISH